ncbi:MAG TPA: hypothetical protein PK563_16070, partial [Tenuifilaceae bacterium]|nr:hypothetical protein [Tenuifilaceae bacterium]
TETFNHELVNDEATEGDNEYEFTFTTPADFTTPGLKYLKFKTFLDGDEDALNDTYSATFYVYPSVSYPYETSFETSSSNWYGWGTNSSWQWGTPNGTIINSASDGTKAWVTSLSSQYNSSEVSYLESPCFDLSTSEYPIFSFDYMLAVEEETDGFYVQYSIDGGLTWIDFPEDANYSKNWYDTGTVAALGKSGWSVNQSSYVKVKNLIPDEAKTSGVKFRFAFASNGSSENEGVAIDQIKVYELPYDLGITALLSPTSPACEIGTVALQFTIENFGYRPVPSATNIPIEIFLNAEEPISESFILPTTLNKNETSNFTTSGTFSFLTAKAHELIAYTNLEE